MTLRNSTIGRQEEKIRNLQKEINRLQNKISDLKKLSGESIISDSDLLAILEKNADGIIIIDTKGIVQYVNHAAELIFDRKKHEFVGMSFGFPIPNDSLQEIIIHKKNGTFSEAELQVVPIRWKGNRSYQLSVRDVSERKRSEEEKIKYEAFIQTALNNIPLIFYFIDRKEFSGSPLELD